jgi:hypothetical protein
MQRNGFCAFQFRLIRTSAYRDCRQVNPVLPTGEDFDLVLKLAETCQFAHVPRKLYSYRQHSGQTSRQNPSHLEMLCKKMMDESARSKATPSFIMGLRYGGIDDAFALRLWTQQQVAASVLIAVVVDEIDPDVLECKEYSQHRVETVQAVEDQVSSWVVSRMVRGAKCRFLPETLVPSPGVLADIVAGKSVPVFELEPRSSWLLQSGALQFDSVRHLVEDSTEFVGEGPPGDSRLYRLTREEVYRDSH